MIFRRLKRDARLYIGGLILLILLGTCVATLPYTLNRGSHYYYDGQNAAQAQMKPTRTHPWLLMGGTKLGGSLLGECLLGGVISLTIGLSAAAISVFLGVTIGVIAGYRGGWIDAILMRVCDILYALPYILLVILFKLALEAPLMKMFNG